MVGINTASAGIALFWFRALVAFPHFRVNPPIPSLMSIATEMVANLAFGTCNWSGFFSVCASFGVNYCHGKRNK